MTIKEIFITSACLALLSIDISVFAQEKLSASSVSLSAGSSTREQDGLSGPVRRVRIESAKILVKEGKTVESPRVLREVTTYGPKGEKIDSVAYPVDSNTLTGKEQYQYDNNGNIMEMVLRAPDGAILSKERYEYESDEFGNWKKMTSSVAVYENGNVTYEPVEVTYRTITYYFSDALTKLSAPAGTAAANVTPAVGDTSLARTGKPRPDRPNITGVAESGSAAKELKKPAVAEPSPANKSEETFSLPPTNVAATVKEESTRLPVIHVSEAVLRKAAVELPEPDLPPEIANAQVEGNVEVQLIVDEKGAVAAVRAISGNPLLMEAAARAGLKARFSPSALSSQPAKIFSVLTYTFGTRKLSTINPTENKTGGSTNNIAAVRSDEKVTPASTLPVAPFEEETKPAPPAADSNKVAATSASQPVERKPDSTVGNSGNTSLAANSAVRVPEKKSNSSTEDPPAKAAAITSPASDSKPLPSKTVSSPAPFVTPFERGMASLATAKYAAAVEYFNQAIRADSTDALAYCRLGLAYSAMEKHKEAIKAYKEAIRLRRAFVDADSYYRLGTAYLQIGDSSAAIDPLKQSLYMIRARVLDSEQHKPAPAAPPQAEVNYALGLAYYGSGAFRNAATEFENAIRLKQDFASAHFGLGLSHLSYGDRRSAEKEEQILRKMKSPLADKLADQIVMPGVRKNRVF